MGLAFGAPAVAECPKDTVQHFQFSRGPHCPSLSPFPLKLETYLRMAKIPYENDLYNRFSKTKSKIPWIRYNGQEVSDSALCIEFLNKERNVDLNKHLSKEEKAIARTYQRMIDDVIYWKLVYYRWCCDEGFKMSLLGFGHGFLLKTLLRPRVIKSCYSQGVSRNSPEEVKNMTFAELQAIEEFLGEKPYLMGNQPSEVDCSLFGMMAQFVYQLQVDDIDKFVKERCPKIVQFCDRMKNEYWSDWDDCITHGGTKPATK